MNQQIIDLYDEYTHAPLDRRVFLARLARLTGSMAAAVALVPLLEASPARAALAGFLALGPDMLSPLGGTPANEDTARDMIAKLDARQTVQSLVAAVAFLKTHAQGNGKAGAMGFCWGGGMVGELAVNAPDLGAGVVYYGRQPNPADVEKIKAPLLLHYAGLDTRLNQGIPAFEDALRKADKKYTLHLYDGANHAFNNDTSEARYSKPAAEQAWARTVAFLKEHLTA